jgi:hypothetical protein
MKFHDPPDCSPLPEDDFALLLQVIRVYHLRKIK